MKRWLRYTQRCSKIQCTCERIRGGASYQTPYLEHKHCLKNWDHRSRDVYVCGFPKSGTTWIQDLVWCLQNNCDLESCKKVFVYARARYLDGLFQFYKVKQSWPDPLRSLIELPGMQMLPDPRVFKTHLPLCLYPDDLLDSSRVVVCFRNPKDVVVFILPSRENV